MLSLSRAHMAGSVLICSYSYVVTYIIRKRKRDGTIDGEKKRQRGRDVPS